MSQFTSELITIEQLFLNNDGSTDKGKNFFIPIYQRDFVWNNEDIEKLITDIFNIMQERNSSNYNDYFIGGIVLCRESVLGESRSNISLEVIDGQQRLTTISIILCFLYQYLKFRKKNFGSKEDYVETIRTTIFNLIKYKKKNNETHEVIDMFKVERSDDIANLYQTILDTLLTKEIENFDYLIKEIPDENNSLVYKQKKEFINLINNVNKNFSNFNEDQLIEFSIQLLDYTRVVVTKTQDIETGFLVFEKLNDNGKKLNPDNLLKNYLFSKASQTEYLQLEDDWKIFLNEIHNINARGTKVSPKEFLENYLIIKGKKIISDKDKVFKIFKKEIYDEKKYSSLELLDELKKTVVEYAALKRDEIISKHLNLLGFKLGYLIFLSMHKKLTDSDYKINKYIILVHIFKLGFCYIITDNSKLLSHKVPEICKEINDLEDSNIHNLLLKLKDLINGALKVVEPEFNDVLTNSNLFDRRKNLTISLFNLLNFYEYGNKYLESSLILAQIIPLPDKLDDFDMSLIKNITVDNIRKYSKFLGNLTLLKYNDELSKDSIEKRRNDVEVSKDLFILKSIAHENIFITSKEDIENRSNKLYKIAYSIFYENRLSVDYFTNEGLNYYFIEKSVSKNAIMEIIDNKYIVKKGSRCSNAEIPYDSFSYGPLRNELIQSKILEKHNNYLKFTEDYSFNSPSAASSIVTARQSAGPLDWKDIQNNTLKENEGL